MIQWWKDLAVSKKLYAVVGVLALLIATELFTLLFAMDVLSAVRSFVGGEGLWSQAQKNAAYNLHRYAYTGDPKFYAEYERHLEIPRGDHDARTALERPTFDAGQVEDAFVRGGNDPADVKSVVRLIRRFYWAPYLKDALRVWREGDEGIQEFIRAGQELRATMERPGHTRAEVERALVKVDAVNERLTHLQNEFSGTLGRGSRWLEGVLTWLLVAAVLTVESTGLFLTITFSRGLHRSLQELMATARGVGAGDYKRLAPVRSRDELGQLAEALNKMSADIETNLGLRQRAEEASQSKSQFLANMSHEIRTPLNVILGMAEILRDPNLPRDEHMRLVDTIERTGKNLTRIINDVLDLSKVEADRMEVEVAAFSLPEFIFELQNMLEVQAAQTQNMLRVHPVGHPPGQIVTDRTRLRQILVNLVSNGLKYTSRGIVTLSYWQDGKRLVFEVDDTGVGIADKDRDKLFEPFARSEDVAKRAEGTGLGLMLSEKLALALGGGVELKASTPGKGSTFLAWIEPREMRAAAPAPKPAVPAATPARDPGALAGRRVLVVEDSEDNQLLVKLLLTRLGLKTEFAGNGQEAVERAPDGDYDFVLMDMQMPVKDGYAATRELRERGYSKPIIALTAHAMKEDRDRCLNAGCDDYLTKPIDSRALASSLRKFPLSV